MHYVFIMYVLHINTNYICIMYYALYIIYNIYVVCMYIYNIKHKILNSDNIEIILNILVNS